ncbi:hypothetical protein CapIbe_021777 [Capra ibex]
MRLHHLLLVLFFVVLSAGSGFTQGIRNRRSCHRNKGVCALTRCLCLSGWVAVHLRRAEQPTARSPARFRCAIRHCRVDLESRKLLFHHEAPAPPLPVTHMSYPDGIRERKKEKP